MGKDMQTASSAGQLMGNDGSDDGDWKQRDLPLRTLHLPRREQSGSEGTFDILWTRTIGRRRRMIVDLNYR